MQLNARKICCVSLLAITPVLAFGKTTEPQQKMKYVDLAPRTNTQPRLAAAGWVIGAGTGLSVLNNSGDTNINNRAALPAPFNQDIYTTSDTSAKAGLFSIFGGYQWHVSNTWLPHLMLAAVYTTQTKDHVGGQVLKGSQAAANNFIYQYNLSTQTFMLRAKADLTTWHHLMPYLAAGIGVARNCFQAYTEQAQASVPKRTSPGFANKTSTSLTTQLGLGIDWQPNAHWLLSLGYAYQYLGDVKSGSGVGTTYTGQSLKQTASQNLFQIQATYLLGKKGDA